MTDVVHSADVALSGWVQAVERLTPVPPQYRRAELDAAAACELLRCTPEVLDHVVSRGFPVDDTADGPRFDYFDVMNLGWLSGSGRSLAELGERYCMRMAEGSPSTWVEPRRSRLRLTAVCPAAPGCTAPVTLPEPCPQQYGGTCERWVGKPARSGQDVDALVVTRGWHGEIGQGVVRELYREMLDGFRSGRHRFAWLPPGLRTDVDRALATGTLDCVASSLVLLRWCRQAGVDARTRKGFLISMIGIEHAWLEVRQQERWLPVDPLLAYLAGRYPASNPVFEEFCLGSISQRVLSWDVPAHLDIARHDCPHLGTPAVSCRQVPEQQ